MQLSYGSTNKWIVNRESKLVNVGSGRLKNPANRVRGIWSGGSEHFPARLIASADNRWRKMIGCEASGISN